MSKVLEKKREEFPEKRPEAECLVPVGKQQLWSFMYGISPSVKQTGFVEASSVEMAEKVAAAWCEAMQFRFIGAKCRPMVLADESILKS